MSETANPLALPDSEDRALKRVWRELNDLGNAQRLYDHSQGLLLWVDELETWAAFDGQRWSILDGVARAEALAHKVARGLRAEVAALRSLTDEQLSTEFGDWCTPDIRTERVLSLHQWATKSGDSGRTQAMLKQARALTVDGKMVMRAALKDFRWVNRGAGPTS